MVTTRNSEIVPFYYQSECLAVLETVEQTQNIGLVVMAGGLGKTILAALNVKRRFKKYGESRCLYLCHQNDVLEQAADDYRKVFRNEATYGLFHGENKSNFDANIIFASFQTMRDNLDLFTEFDFDEVVVDESHHSMAETYEPVIRYFTPKFLLGITMYPDRLDGLDIRDIYGKEVYSLSMVTALARGLLCPVDYRLMSDEIGSLKKLDTIHGRLSIRLLNNIVFIPKRDKEIAEIIQLYMQTLDDPRVMIFCPSVEHAEIMAELVKGTIPLHSKITKTEKRVRLELFRNGAFKGATSVDMFNEGLDVKEINLIVFLRSTSSPNIFYNQLARGVRLLPGKEKVIVLDFVGNCERALEVYELWTKVKAERQRLITTGEIIVQLPGEKAQPFLVGSTTITKRKVHLGPTIPLKDVLEPFTLNVNEVSFKEKIVPIIERIQKIREGFYQTWEEAQEATQLLGIKSWYDYIEKYNQDSMLPSNPQKYYLDFPGFDIFLRGSIKEFYPTWQEAGKAAADLGIKNRIEYQQKYKLDPKLTAVPERFYKDYPGLDIFLGRRYETWQLASEAAIRLGIKNIREYHERYKEDSRLQVNPDGFYSDFPGFEVFLGKTPKKLYSTWEEASKIAIGLGIKSRQDYQFRKRYKEDEKLPAVPERTYGNFPGWDIFLGKK